jgi:ParB-like chromosome segregation protein Spo0J
MAKRILQTKQVKIADLIPYPGNPRTHDLDFICESLEAHGQFRAIVVRKKDLMVLAGHGTVQGARKLGWETIAAHLVEADDDQARAIMLADNKANDRGGYDEKALLAILEKAPNLKGTGFEKADLTRLQARTVPAEPADNQAAAPKMFEVLVTADTEDEQRQLLEVLTKEGWKCRALA